LFELLRTKALRLLLVVPAERFTAVRDVATLAVTVDAFKPNETPLLLLNVNALARFDVVPALRLNEPWVLATVTLAVICVDPDMPKVTLFELLKTTVPEVAVCVPAAMAAIPAAAPGFTVAVIVDPLRPNETPLLFENTTADKLFDVVPADTLMFVRLVAMLAVMTDEFDMPNVTPLLLLNSTVPLVAV
jgi:hypothetical protein